MTKKEQFHKRAHLFLLLLLAFFLPSARLLPVFIVLLLINWLAEADFKRKFKAIFSNKLALIFVGFYFIHLLGLTYTQNMPSGWFDLEVKLSILIFPIVLGGRPLNRDDINKVFSSLTLGCCFALLIMLGRAIVLYFVSGENNFYYQALSFLIHPSYISMYIDLCIAWILYSYLKGEGRSTRFLAAISFGIVLFFSGMIILLSSKMGFLTLLFLYFGFLVYYVVKRKKYMLGISGILILGISLLGLWHFVPEFKDRMTSAINAVTAEKTDQADGESTAVRLLIWSAANEVISENPIIGAGTGDPKDELMKEYERRGMTGAIEHKLNAHNEYYQVFVSLGLIGFIFLLINLLAPLWKALRKHNTIYVLFLCIVMFNFLAESMLETQAGVIFYAFMNSLLCFSIIETEEKNKQNKV